MVLIAKWELSELKSCQAYNPAIWPLWNWPDNICPKSENPFSELLRLGSISCKFSHCTGGNEHYFRTMRTAPRTSVNTAVRELRPGSPLSEMEAEGRGGRTRCRPCSSEQRIAHTHSWLSPCCQARRLGSLSGWHRANHIFMNKCALRLGARERVFWQRTEPRRHGLFLPL